VFGNLGLDELFDLVHVLFADRLTKPGACFAGQRVEFFGGDEGFALVRVEGHQARARSEATNCSTLAERT
jgi:hypothetical protein